MQTQMTCELPTAVEQCYPMSLEFSLIRSYKKSETLTVAGVDICHLHWLKRCLHRRLNAL